MYIKICLCRYKHTKYATGVVQILNEWHFAFKIKSYLIETLYQCLYLEN